MPLVGARFIVDQEAKAQKTPTAKLRGWSSDEIKLKALIACMTQKVRWRALTEFIASILF